MVDTAVALGRRIMPPFAQEVEVAVAVQVDQVQAAQPPLGMGGIVVLDDLLQPRFLRDVGKTAAPRRAFGPRRRADRRRGRGEEDQGNARDLS